MDWVTITIATVCLLALLIILVLLQGAMLIYRDRCERSHPKGADIEDRASAPRAS